ncbi:hypothetical protein [Deinococcus sp. Marseille-Q6407]|uniref:hypothetical protein n=1 Tax=Deinococcus sp. Marseille-Q6407 TaxID=2969223 RepID=UPI0021C133BF|nr:hypothetical protein [Deinococcus sp. Marseille-Q6407]
MPKILLTSVLAALGLSGLLLASAAAPRPAALTLPLQTAAQLCAPGATKCQALCPETDCVQNVTAPLISLTTVKALAAATGLEVSVSDEVIDGKTYLNMLRLGLPDEPDEEVSSLQTPAMVGRGGELYYRASSVLGFLIQQGGEARFSSLPGLSLEVRGRVIGLQLGSAAQGEELLRELSFTFLEALLPEAFRPAAQCPSPESCSSSSPIVSARMSSGESYRVQTGLAEGEVVMLALPLSAQGPDDASYAVAVSPVDDQGWAEFSVSEAPKRFVSRREAVLSRPENRGNALLVRVTNTPLNDLWGGIIQPAQVK